MTYRTIQGDTFDSIAKKIYGDEKYLKNILRANAQYIDTIIFPENIELIIPELEIKSNDTSLPLWRRE